MVAVVRDVNPRRLQELSKFT